MSIEEYFLLFNNEKEKDGEDGAEKQLRQGEYSGSSRSIAADTVLKD